MPLIVAGVSAVGSYLGGKGKKKAQQRQNQMYQQMYSPASVNARAAQLNPYLYGALAGQRGTSGYQNSLYNIAQNPGYIDPSLMNAPYLQSAQRQQSDLQTAQGMLGRNQIGGGTGLGAAYALANQGARTSRDTQLGQQYALWREQQRRSDIDWLSGQQQQAQGMAMSGIQGTLGGYQAPMNGAQLFGGALAAGASGYAGAQAAGLNMPSKNVNTNPPAFSTWGSYNPSYNPYGGGNS